MFVSKKHDHKNCVSRLESKVSQVAADASSKLNENESRVMRVLAETHRALGAYDIARHASDDRKNLQPVQIYRAIDKLTELGLVHKVKTEGGYVACHAHEGCSMPMFLICTSCRQVAETENAKVEEVIKQSVAPTQFLLQQQNIELLGLCPDCSNVPSQQ